MNRLLSLGRSRLPSSIATSIFTRSPLNSSSNLELVSSRSSQHFTSVPFGTFISSSSQTQNFITCNRLFSSQRDELRSKKFRDENLDVKSDEVRVQTDEEVEAAAAAAEEEEELDEDGNPKKPKKKKKGKKLVTADRIYERFRELIDAVKGEARIHKTIDGKHELDPFTLEPKNPGQLSYPAEDIEVRKVLDKTLQNLKGWRYWWLPEPPFYAPWEMRIGRNPYVWLWDRYQVWSTRIIPIFLDIIVFGMILYVVWYFSQPERYWNVNYDLDEVEFDRIKDESRYTLRDWIGSVLIAAKDVRNTIFHRIMLKKALNGPQFPAGRYTIIMDQEALVQEINVYPHGLMVRKRPGLDFFLIQLTQGPFELITFSSRPQKRANYLPVFMDVDNCLIHNSLYREDCVKLDGPVYIKDLQYVNRRPEMLMMFDTKLSNVNLENNAQNAVIIPPWMENRMMLYY